MRAGAEFTKQSQSPRATTGSLAVYIDDRQVGSWRTFDLEEAMAVLSRE